MRASVSQSVERAFQIISLFEVERRPLGRGAIAEGLDAPKSSVSALLLGMTELGILSYDRGSQTYFPTERLGRMAGWIMGMFTIPAPVLEAMTRLQQETRETITLVTPLQQELEVIRVEPGLEQISYVSYVGQIIPLWGSAVGSVHLSSMSDDAIAAMYHRARAATANWRPRPNLDTILERVNSVREDGYFLITGTIASDAAALAMAVPPRICGAKSLVLCVSGPSERITRNRSDLVAALVRAIDGMMREADKAKAA